MAWSIATLPAFDEMAAKGEIEQKYVFSAGKAGLLLDWLEFHLLRDRQYYFGPILSLYYDTPAFDLYDQVRNGDYLKTKVRLRWYQKNIKPQQQLVDCYLEVKHKIGGLRYKKRNQTTLPAALFSEDLFSDSLIADAPALLPELPTLVRGVLVPILIVEYERYRFVDPRSGSRIALDAAIVCRHTNPAFIAGFPPVFMDLGVLEVKGQQDSLPDFLRPMSGHLNKQPFSKYAACCESLNQPLSWRNLT